MSDKDKCAGDVESELYYLVSATKLRKKGDDKNIVFSVDLCTVINYDCPSIETMASSDPGCYPI